MSLESLKELFVSVWHDFYSRDYFQEYFGKSCIDGDDPGKMGEDIGSYFLRKLRKSNLWPISENYKNYTEEDVFDVIEFLYDCVSLPLEEKAFYHNYCNCGWHYHCFDAEAGRREYRSEINQFLADYESGYELTESGEIIALGPEDLQPIFDAKVPKCDHSVEDKLKKAANKFRKYGASRDDQREAVRSLADVLEFIRPEAKKVLTKKDESDLFEIANNFGIRHHNQKQKIDYDESVWLSWMFYFYYSTILACLHLLNRQNGDSG